MMIHEVQLCKGATVLQQIVRAKPGLAGALLSGSPEDQSGGLLDCLKSATLHGF
jgi:hypothetical protein